MKNRIRTFLHTLWLAALSLFLGVQSAYAQPLLYIDSLSSPSVGKTKSFAIFVPSQPGNRKYPVLYLLHGYGGNHLDWSRKTKLSDYLSHVPLVVVMPDGENSWYVDAAAKKNAKFEQFLLKDLPAYVEKNYPVDASKQAIAGLSMGGYGATMLAMKHPDRFAFSASLSGALTFPRFLGDSTLQPLSGPIKKNLEEVFGEPGSISRKSNDPFELFRSVPADSSIYFYFAVGIQDGFKGFLPVTRRLADSLRVAKIPYEYHETPGRHDWKFWDAEIHHVLIKLREWMKLEDLP